MRSCNVEIDLESTKQRFIQSVDMKKMGDGKRLKLGLVRAIEFGSKMEMLNSRTARWESIRYSF